MKFFLDKKIFNKYKLLIIFLGLIFILLFFIEILNKEKNIENGLISKKNCEDIGWFFVDGKNDVYIGKERGNGFCISPRIGDFSCLDYKSYRISWNGWGNQRDGNYNGWNSGFVSDSGNPLQNLGQTRFLDGKKSYSCLKIGEAKKDFIGLDTIEGRMKWLAENKDNITALQDIDWIKGLGDLNGNPVPALFLADCIDGEKNLGKTMFYKHKDDNLEKITYDDYKKNVVKNTEEADLWNKTYQNRQKYLTAWTQQSGSHLPSAFSYISDGFAGAEDEDGDNYKGRDKGEYQVACEKGVFKLSDKKDRKWIWLSAIGYTNGTSWGRIARLIGNSGCLDQDTKDLRGYRNCSFAVRIIVRP